VLSNLSNCAAIRRDPPFQVFIGQGGQLTYELAALFIRTPDEMRNMKMWIVIDQPPPGHDQVAMMRTQLMDPHLQGIQNGKTVVGSLLQVRPPGWGERDALRRIPTDSVNR
jgi:hypothetical protein